VTLKASINYTGNTSMVVGVRVESENIQSGICTHCNSSYFTMIAKDKDGNNAPTPGIIIDTEQKARRFLRSIETRKSYLLRESKYEEKSFELTPDLLDELKQNNLELALS